VFIDTYYDRSNPVEVEKFQHYTETLWNIARFQFHQKLSFLVTQTWDNVFVLSKFSDLHIIFK